MFQKMLLLTSFMLVLGMAAASPADLDNDPNLVGWWKFDGDTSDASGNGRDGTLVGEALLVDEGILGGALSLDGDGDYVTIVGYKGINADRTDPANPFQKPFTVTCWIKTTSNGSLVNWGSSDGTGVGGQYQNFRIDGGRLRAEHGNGRFRGAATVNDGEWHNVAMAVAQGADLYPPGTQLYVDGVKDTEGADTVNAQNIWNLTEDADVGIGVRASHTDRFLAGMFDDVRIYDRQLTGEEIRIMLGLLQAYQPVPADGAVDVDPGTLEWLAGPTAVSHKVYLSADPIIDEADLIAETEMTIVAVVLEPGITYSWRVDEVEADGKVIEGDVWTFSTMPLEAHFPVPADGTTGLEPPVTLSWTPGKVVVMHDLYFGTDEAAIAAGDMSTFKGKLMQASYDPGPLELFTTYYWRVDEFTPTGTVKGPVWSFSTADYVPIESGQTTLNYDNTVEPYVSEAAFDTPADLTHGGRVSDLSLRFRGRPDSLSIDEATGTYQVAGSGVDIWGTSDQFHYVYKGLTGDATIIARVVDHGTGSNAWAKGGVMIRETIDAGSRHAFVCMTPGNGKSFQNRKVTDERSWNSNTGGFQSPYWVKLVREGNQFTAYHSADGMTWELQAASSETANPETIEMADSVLIGLAVTSHAAGEIRTFTFDNVSIEGNVSADFVSQDVASVSGNSAEPVYAVLEDSTGATAMVIYPDPAATQIADWQPWRIPLSEFAGVDLTAAVKLYVGVGDGNPGGVGAIDIAEIRVVESEVAGNIIWVSYHGADDAPTAAAVGLGFTEAPDKTYTDLLKANGYNVMRYITTGTPDVDVLNAADLVIIGRSAASGHYQNDAATRWNATVTAPIIITCGYKLRSSRMGFTTGTDMPDTTGDIRLTVTDPTHPIFDGIALTDGTMDNPFAGVVTYADGTLARGISINNNPLDDEGILLATISEASAAEGPVGGMVIAEWPAGASLTHSGGAGTDVLAGPRLVFLTGAREASGLSSETAGLFDLYEDGAQMLLNAVKYMVAAQ